MEPGTVGANDRAAAAATLWGLCLHRRRRGQRLSLDSAHCLFDRMDTTGTDNKQEGAAADGGDDSISALLILEQVLAVGRFRPRGRGFVRALPLVVRSLEVTAKSNQVLTEEKIQALQE